MTNTLRTISMMFATAAALVAGSLAVAATPAQALGTGEACVFNAPLGGSGDGHVGWGFRIDQSDSWIYGATEDPTGQPWITVGDQLPGGGKAPAGSWHAQGSMATMLNDFATDAHWGSWPDANLDGGGPPKPHYTRYRCWSVANSAVTAAKNAVTFVEQTGQTDVGFPNDLYRLLGWNCMNHAYYILSAYNTSLSSPSNPVNYYPNNWFNNLPGTSTPLNAHAYQVTGVDSSGLAVQTQPHVNHVDHYVGNGTTLYVVCQTKYGDQVDGATQYGRPFTTWDMLFDGEFVYDWYMNTPTVGTNGYSDNIQICPGG